MALVAAGPVVGPSATLAVSSGSGETAPRTSGLEAPTIRLSGHSGEVYACEFSPDGRTVATAGADRTVLLYNVYGECRSFLQLRGHTKAILEITFSEDGELLYTASADESICCYDTNTGQRVKKMKGHLSAVNSIATMPKRTKHGIPVYGDEAAVAAVAGGVSGTSEGEKVQDSQKSFLFSAKNQHTYTNAATTYSSRFMLASGGDDGSTRVWDLRTNKCAMKTEHQYQILSVALDAAGFRVFAGSLDNTIRMYDLRSGLFETGVLKGHGDSVTGVALHPDGSHLLSNSMDQTVRVWDVQPFLGNKEDRLVGYLKGATHNFEKLLLRVRFSGDGAFAAAGSADRTLCVWNVQNLLRAEEKPHPVASPLYRLPGHTGSLNDVAFHPLEPIVASASSDKTCFIGELS